MLLPVTAHGQSIDAKKITFDCVRLPLVLLPAGTCSYPPEMVLHYADAVKQQKADHETAVADAKSEVEKDKQEYKA